MIQLNPGIKEKIIKEINELPDDVLPEIDKLIQTLKGHKPALKKNKKFDKYFNTISDEDAREMLEAIEDFERIEPDAW